MGVFTKNLLTVTDGMNPHCERLRSKLHKLQLYIITNQQDTGQEKQSSLGLILYLLLILFFFFYESGCKFLPTVTHNSRIRALEEYYSRALLLGGNAGMAAAFVARKMGVPATIVIPSSSPELVVQKLQEQGATVKISGKVSYHISSCYLSHWDTAVLWLLSSV